MLLFVSQTHSHKQGIGHAGTQAESMAARSSRRNRWRNSQLDSEEEEGVYYMVSGIRIWLEEYVDGGLVVLVPKRGSKNPIASKQ